MVNEKVVLVTGAARRIGKSIAKHFHHYGYNVIIHFNSSREEAYSLVDQLNSLRGDSAICFQADLLEHTHLHRMIECIHDQWGRLDVVVNNASIFFPTSALAATSQQWDRLINTNLKAPYFLIQSALHLLKQVKGNVINITDIHSHKPLKGYDIYSISKAGLEMLTKTMARELAPEVRVNGVAPGAILWPEGNNLLDESQKMQIIEASLLKRHGEALDIAQAVYFLSCSSFITGQILAVDGGRSIK